MINYIRSESKFIFIGQNILDSAVSSQHVENQANLHVINYIDEHYKSMTFQLLHS